MEEVRLNKYLSLCGECSRREADTFIEEGRVLVNGAVASMGQKVSSNDEVVFDGRIVKMPLSMPLYAFYKPVGVTVTAKDVHAEKTIYDLISISGAKGLKYAGRLDRDSEGLLLLTADGDFIEQLMRGSHGHEKEYIVTLDREPAEADMEALSKGVYLEELNRTTRPCEIKRSGKRTVSMVLTEGLNREIRRLWQLKGYNVERLKRVRVATITVDGLKPGEIREIKGGELARLRESLS